MNGKDFLAASIFAALGPALLNYALDEGDLACVATLPSEAVASDCHYKEPALSHDHRESDGVALFQRPTYRPTTGITVARA